MRPIHMVVLHLAVATTRVALVQTDALALADGRSRIGGPPVETEVWSKTETVARK